MTNEERQLAIYCLKASNDFYTEVCEECIEFPNCDHFKIDELMSKVIKALEQQPRWIPCSDPLNELPKDRLLYVTTKPGCVETLFYDMTEWSDVDIARSTVAYMDYYEPQPYEAESEDKE